MRRVLRGCEVREGSGDGKWYCVRKGSKSAGDLWHVEYKLRSFFLSELQL